jgi:hypothetical protein
MFLGQWADWTDKLSSGIFNTHFVSIGSINLGAYVAFSLTLSHLDPDHWLTALRHAIHLAANLRPVEAAWRGASVPALHTSAPRQSGISYATLHVGKRSASRAGWCECTTEQHTMKVYSSSPPRSLPPSV